MVTRKKSDSPSGDGSHKDLPAPGPGALDVLAVLWREKQQADRPLPLSEVHRLVCERRQNYGEPPAPLSTVSSTLQKLVAQQLVEGVEPHRPVPSSQPVRTRGGYRPPTRSAVKGYRALYDPGLILHTTFYGLAEAYPPDRRLDALLDFAKALSLPAATLAKVNRLVEEEKAARAKTETA